MYNLIVIGSGPGGYKSALKACKLGKKVLLIEKDTIGGVCLNRGCIPTKSLLNSAKTYKKAKSSLNIGVESYSTNFNMGKAIEWKNSKVAELRDSLEKFLSSKVEVVKGEATIIDKNSVVVNNQIYKGEYILIATGSSPVTPPITGIQSDIVYNSTSILNLTTLPQKLVIIGGGVIGIEFASLYKMLGVEVTIVEMAPNLLNNFDDRLVKTLIKELGVNIFTNSIVEEITDHSIKIRTNNDLLKLNTDCVLLATGRKPNSKQFEDLGITNISGVVTNCYLQTDIDTIYAIGDVTGKSFLAHGSEAMGDIAIENMFVKENSKIFENHNIPGVVYSDPELASVGLSLKASKEKKISIDKKVYYLKNNGRYLVENGLVSGICIILLEKDSKKVLGVQAIGSNVSELISIASIAIKMGLNQSDFEDFIFPHPTTSEIIKEGIIGF